MIRQKLILVLVAVTALSSCLRDRTPGPVAAVENREVEIVLNSKPVTRAATDSGTPDERVVADLDLLVFGPEGFRLWRSAYKVGDRFRATLPVSSGIDVYFIANSRALITALSDGGQLDAGLTWEQARLKLVDKNPARLVASSGSVALPMWGRLLDQTVADVPVNKWAAVSMIRSVASVDVYVNPDVDNFTLEDLRLYFVPDAGLVAPSEANYDAAKLQVREPESPAGMKTSLTLSTNRYDAANLSIANVLYLYENDTDGGNMTQLPNTNRRYTRLVIGGMYEGSKYYYPVDFVTDDDEPDRITRNWKYVFMINSASSRGYTDPDTASTEPMVGLSLDIVNWNVDGETDFWVSGPFYLGFDGRTVTLSRPAGSTGSLTARSNILSDIITLEFASAANGPTTGTGTANDGIANDRFRVEKIKGANGFITGLKITALGDYDPVAASRNGDTVVLTSGRIRAEIRIIQIASSDTDWMDGGEVGGGVLE